MVLWKIKAAAIIQRNISNACQKWHNGDRGTSRPYRMPPKLLEDSRSGAEKAQPLGAQNAGLSTFQKGGISLVKESATKQHRQKAKIQQKKVN